MGLGSSFQAVTAGFVLLPGLCSKDLRGHFGETVAKGFRPRKNRFPRYLKED